MPGSPQVTVFESVNFSRREIFVAASAVEPRGLAALLSESPPAEIRHWAAGDWVALRILELDLDCGVAFEFINKYAGTHTAWRVMSAKRLLGP